MQYATFQQVIANLQKRHSKVLTAAKIGLNLGEFDDELYAAINNLLMAIYGNDGKDWIEWFLYENHPSGGPLARDADGKPICYDVKSLWEYLERSH
jgi:hypothetical protein